MAQAYDIQTIPSSFGGGWALPLTPAGRQALHDFFGADPCALAPLGDAEGYIVEPCEVQDLAEHVESARLTLLRS